MENSEKLIPVAIIGLGKIARDQHLSAIEKTGIFKLAATVSSGSGIENIPNYKTLSELIASETKIEAVSICTPPQVRAPLVIEAIKNGLHVFMEKPPTSTLGAFEGVLKNHADSEITLYTSWHSRHAPMVKAAKEWVDSHNVIDAKIIWRESAKKWHPGQTWLWEAGGLGVFDPGINAFSIITHLLGGDIEVLSSKFEVPSNWHSPIGANCEMRAGDIPLNVNLDFRENDREVWEIHLKAANNDTLVLKNGGAAISLNGGEFVTEAEEEYPNLYREFGALIKEGKSNTDISPQRLVADSFMLAEITKTDSFEP